MSTSVEPADIGIDLGTTYSVIAIKGRVELQPAYGKKGIYVEECDATIIPAPSGDPSFPSVFWVEPEDGRVVIGMDAKRKAEEGGAPIMFSKRSIGTMELLPLHDRTYTAQQVAEHILRYLKECAERALGRPVRRAVVTHPAYFDRNKVEETRAAAVAAGFDMRDDRQMMMEPAAAALAHTCTIKEDPLTIVVYDLGGGTFDVTVLQRKEGVIRMLAFDGDHLLGGYNFDRALVQWILNQLRENGRTIPYDEANADDRARRAQLLQFAEDVKMSLSEPQGKTGVPVRNQRILVDDSGNKVQILETINRAQFTALIKDDLEKTLECTERALKKAAAKTEDGVCKPDFYLLVGGSTYGPWVSDAVSARFQVEVTPFNPDTCVAIGAALVADTLSKDAIGGGLSLALDVPHSTPLSLLNISGTVLTNDNKPLPDRERQGLRVRLHATERMEPVPLETNGTFLFADLPLQENGPTDFRVEVLDAQGFTRIEKEFAITYAPDKVEGEIYPAVPKSIYVKTKDGLVLVAEEGETLPAKCEISRPKLHKDDSFDISVIQDGEEVTRIGVSGIPESAGEGSIITVSVEVTQQNRMLGTLTVTNPKGAILAKSDIAINFPPLRIPELPELHDLFEELNAEREQEAFNTSDPDRRSELEGKGVKIARKIEKLLAEGMGKEKQEIYRELMELKKVVQPPPEDMDPPRAKFRELLEDCQDLLSRNSSNPEVQPLAEALKKIEAKADEAYRAKNHKNWAAENGNLVTLYQRLSKLGGGGEEQELPPTPILKDSFAQRIDQLRSRLNSQRNALESLPRYATHFKPRLDVIEAEIGQMDAALAKVDDDLPPKQGLPKCQLAYRPAAGLEKRIKEVEHGW